jgi:phytoene dehydrogenase-like protein
MMFCGGVRKEYDVVVIGAGPNGLSAAIALAQEGLSTLLVEAHARPGGGARSDALTLEGFVHDVCSTVHPLGAASPFFRSLPLQRYGLRWIESPSPLAHVLSDGRAVMLERTLEATAEGLGRDGPAYRRLLGPYVRQFDTLLPMLLGPLRMPSSPLLFAQFGLCALRSMRALASERFFDPPARALLAGIAAHAMVPLHRPATASFALVLAMAAHVVGWPLARGGSQAITDALVAHYQALGGELVLGCPVQRLSELPKARAYVLDVTPRQVLEIAGDELPGHYQARLRRFRYGPGVYKVDWALSGPIPWKDARCLRAATVHLSGSMKDVADAELSVHRGHLAEHPFILLVQPTLFDPSRAPRGKHIAWAYCHVPHGSSVDAACAIEAEIERFAPGFTECVLARRTHDALSIQHYNANYVGGDINGGISDARQLFFRPVMRADPYATPAPHVFLCSSSTPPGGGVHGMCGYWAARSVLARAFGRELSPLKTDVEHAAPAPAHTAR